MGRAEQLAWRVLQPDVRLAAARLRWHFRHAEVGPGAYVVGRPYVECRDLHVGARLTVLSQDRRVRLGGRGRIDLGDDVILNAGCMVMARAHVVIEDLAGIGYDAIVTDSNDHGLEGRLTRTEPVRIGRGAWIGARAIILPGVSVGSRAVVAAGAIVTRSVADDTMVAGQPARVVRALTYPPGVARAFSDDPVP